MLIGQKTKTLKPSQPQVVCQRGQGQNEFLLLTVDPQGGLLQQWIGDPKAATKWDSRYAAKCRIRDIEGLPEGRVWKELP